MVRGAFEYSGQKCSAASRSYVPASLWPALKDRLIAETEDLTVGSVEDFGNFTSAVIDDRSFGRLKAAIDRAHATDSIEVLAGGTYDDSVGYFVRPTLLLGTDPRDEIFCNEYFGPILSIHVYPDDEFDSILTRGRHRLAVRADRFDHRQGPGGGRQAGEASAVHRRQLLHQRQADRGGRRPAAVRRCQGVGHQRQGGLGGQPDALDLTAVDQGNLRRAHVHSLPAPGSGLTGFRLTGWPRRNDSPWAFPIPGRAESPMAQSV